MLPVTGGLQRTNTSLSNPDQPVCLICLEPLTADDFESGEAMKLDCQCRGDMRLRHKTCASKWVDVSVHITAIIGLFLQNTMLPS